MDWFLYDIGLRHERVKPYLPSLVYAKSGDFLILFQKTFLEDLGKNPMKLL